MSSPAPLAAVRADPFVRQEGRVFWITGLAGAGKSAVGRGLRARMLARGQRAVLLDGDEVRRKHPPKAAGYLGLSLVAAHFR